MFFPNFLGIMNKFITNVHDATPKTHKNNPQFFSIFSVWKKNMF